jgi:hypothetical protein
LSPIDEEYRVIKEFKMLKNYTRKDFIKLFESTIGKNAGILFFERSKWLESLMQSDRAGCIHLYIKYVRKFRDACYNPQILTRLK